MVGKLEVNDPSASALSSSCQMPSRFPKSSGPLNDIAFLRIFN
jgi:hypothetical protein